MPKSLSMLPRLVTAGFFLVAATATPQLALAAGDDSGDSSGGRYGNAKSVSAVVTNANKALGKDDFAAAYAILDAGLSSEPDNADIHDLLGFSARKMGRYDDSMKHYQKALTINPKHKGALEYMGELYLTLDQPDEARALLERLDNICWLTCKEERELKAAIEAWEAANG